MVEFAGEKNMMARQTIFGLFGDIQGRIVDSRRTFLTELIKHATKNLEYDPSITSAAGYGAQIMQDYGSMAQHNALSVCTNACWTLGEVAVTSSKESKNRGSLSTYIMLALL